MFALVALIGEEIANQFDEPIRVFENLYYIGFNDVGAWAVETSEGIILIDTLNSPDEARDERFPVDGGVFDIPVGGTEVLVPIRAAVPVTQATLFAVTVQISLAKAQ